MTSATLGSTITNQQLARRLPPDLLRQVRGYLDELQRLQAKQPDPDKITAKKDRAAHARESKTRRLHAAIDAMIEGHRPQLVAWTGSRYSRAIWAKKQIEAKADDKTLVPSWRYIDDYLNTLQI